MKGLRARRSPRQKSQLGPGCERLVRQGWPVAKLWLTDWGQYASLNRVISGVLLCMRPDTKPYPPASVVGQSLIAAITLPPATEAVEPPLANWSLI